MIYCCGYESSEIINQDHNINIEKSIKDHLTLKQGDIRGYIGSTFATKKQNA